MPKLLVLFDPNGNASASLAEAAASGARGVRFMEVDVRTIGASANGVPPVDPASAHDYDGILLVADSRPVSSALDAFIADLATSGDTSNVVFAGVGDGSGAILSRCIEQGAIVTSVRGSGDSRSDAAATGTRAAKVVGWIHHALGHEAEHHEPHVHHHVHSHDQTH